VVGSAIVIPTKQDALTMATEREEWAKAARERDQPGSAREFELDPRYCCGISCRA